MLAVFVWTVTDLIQAVFIGGVLLVGLAAFGWLGASNLIARLRDRRRRR